MKTSNEAHYTRRPRMRRASEWVRCALISIMATATLAVSQEVNEPLSAVKRFPYLYAVEGNINASAPVIDHLAPSDRGSAATAADGDTEDRPEFIFSGSGYRIVEWYVHWCDICKNFKPKYMALGKRVQELGKAQNVSIAVHAISCGPNRPLCKALAIDKYPAFRVYTPGDTIGLDVPHAQVHPVTVLQKMGIDAGDDAQDDWDTTSSAVSKDMSWLEWGKKLYNTWMNPQHVPGKFDHVRTRDELRQDVHLSFDYAMRQGVFMSNDPLTDEKAEVLFEWFHVLQKTLPPSWKSLHTVISNLLANFDYVKRSEEYLISILEDNPPPSTLWSMACSRGDPDAGYSCGLWQLFHVVTVGVVDYNRATSFDQNRLHTEVVARTIRDYIHNFFGCDVCRRNFVTAFSVCAHDRCQRLLLEEAGEEKDWIQLPLWLFETHNSVNVRLMKEKAARENRDTTQQDEIDVTWPPARDCQRCWDEQLKSNSNIVYKYLKIVYGQRDGLAAEFQKEVFAPVAEDREEKDNWWSEITKWIQSISISEEHQRTLEDARVDAHRSFVHVLRNNVHKHSVPLSGKERTALRNWLDLLDKTLPPSWNEIHALIKELLENFSFAVRSKDYLVSILDDYPAAIDEPTAACSADNSHTCGLWELVQVATVGVIHHNQLVASSDEERIATKKAALTIRDFFLHYSDCEVSRRHFSTAFDACSQNRCNKLLERPGNETDWAQLPLWLYETRNTVYLELVKQNADRDNRQLTAWDKIGAQWPPQRYCRQCWHEDGQSDPQTVYRYLLLNYGPRNTVNAGLAESSLEPKIDVFKSGKTASWWSKLLQMVNGEAGYQKRTPEEIRAAASFAFDRMMRYGVFQNDESLPDGRRVALRAWLNLLQRTLPSSWSSMRELVNELLQNFSYVVKTKEYLIAVLDEYPPVQSTPSFKCSNETRSVSFPCGTWDLLHTVTLGVLSHNRGAADKEILFTERVAHDIKDSVANFLDCDLCEKFFVQAFKDCGNDQCSRLVRRPGIETDWVRLSLWLCSIRNSVAVKFWKEKAAKEKRTISSSDEINVLWPSRTECDRCWHDDGLPNEEVTYRFIEYLYGHQVEDPADFHAEL